MDGSNILQVRGWEGRGWGGMQKSLDDMGNGPKKFR